MENKSHALAAGIFVIVVTALLAGLAIWLTRDNANYDLYELTTSDGVSGLQPQAAVRYKGVAVGKVQRIGFDPQVSGNVLIRIAVNHNAPVSPTTFATLGYQGVTGLAHVLLDDATQPLPQLPPGPSGLPRLTLKPSPFGRIAEQAPNILAQVEEATRRINQLLGDENQQRITQALGNIGQTAGSVNALTQRLDATLQNRLDPALAALPPLADDARHTLKSLQQAGTSVTAMANDIRTTTQRLSAEGGAIDQPWVELAGLLDHAPSRSAVVAALLAQLLPALDQFDAHGLSPFLSRYAGFDALAGREVAIHEATGAWHATAFGIGDDGALRVRDASGSERRVHAGDVSVRA